MSGDVRLVALKYGESTLPCDQLYRDGDASLSERISFMIFLLTVGRRRILIDAGCETMPGFVMEHFCSPVEILERYGISPEQITDLVITHAHHDHVAAAARFPNAKVILHADAYKRAGKYLSANARVQTFQRTKKLADGIQVKWIGGHARGSSVVLVEHGEKIYVLCGDECYVPRCFREGIPTGVSKDPDRSLAFVRTYAQAPYVPLCCHDPARLPYQNGFEIVF